MSLLKEWGTGTHYHTKNEKIPVLGIRSLVFRVSVNCSFLRAKERFTLLKDCMALVALLVKSDESDTLFYKERE